MKRRYRLIKLRTSKVEDLMRLKTQVGKASLDELMTMMIEITAVSRRTLKEFGWNGHASG